eukprot:1158786-Pelagomonas_calceolata.AAC.19
MQVVECRNSVCSWTSSIAEKHDLSFEVHNCAREQRAQLDFVRFSSVDTASDGYGIMCLAHLEELHKQEQCSYPAAALQAAYMQL